MYFNVNFNVRFKIKKVRLLVSELYISLPMYVISILQNFMWYIFNCYTYLTLCCSNSMPISDLQKREFKRGCVRADIFT